MLSVVIITKNEEKQIGKTLQALVGLSDDIIIVDSGSTDNTIAVSKQFPVVTIMETVWLGYGATKNLGIEKAKYDWILSLDADEVPDEKLKQSLDQINLENKNIIYSITRENYFCNKRIKFGEWSSDTHMRVFNRSMAKWNDALVHEDLDVKPGIKVINLEGKIKHYTSASVNDYIEKTMNYARLHAEKNFKQGKKASFIKLYVAPAFGFIKHYFFELGFLDGYEGYLIAKTTAWYGFLKYAYLRDLTRQAAANKHSG